LRWSLFQQDLDFTIKHKAGKLNSNADGLSRREYDPEPEVVAEDEDLLDESTKLMELQEENILRLTEEEYDEWMQDRVREPVCVSFKYGKESEVIDRGKEIPEDDVISAVDDLQQLQSECPDISRIITYLRTGELPLDVKLARQTVFEAENYFFQNGLLYHKFTHKNKHRAKAQPIMEQLVVPSGLRVKIMYQYHDQIGHPNHERTYATIKDKYYWSKMYTEIKTYCKHCETCGAIRKETHSKKAPLKNVEVKNIFDIWGFDVVGPIPKSKEGYCYVLVAVEHLTKWCEIMPLKTQTAPEIAEQLFQHVFCRFGPPRAILSDRAKNLTGAVVQRLANLFRVKRLRTSSYHPMSNGQVESLNRSIWKGLRTYCKDQDNWPDYLQPIALSYRATVSAYSTKYSPYQLIYGRPIDLPFDHELLEEKTEGKTSADQYMRSLEERVRMIREAAALNIAEAQEKSKRIYDKKSVTRNFEIGQNCWLYVPPPSKKGESKKMKRCYKKVYISSKISDHDYMVVDSETQKLVKHPVHVNRLREFFSEKDLFPDKPTEIGGEGETSGEEENLSQESEEEDPQDCIQDLPEGEIKETDKKVKDTNFDTNNTEKKENKSKLKGPSSEESKKKSERTTGSGNEEVKMDHDREGKWFEAESLLGVKIVGGERHYKVKWKDKEFKPSWEKEGNISDYLKQVYHAKHTLLGKVRKRH